MVRDAKPYTGYTSLTGRKLKMQRITGYSIKFGGGLSDPISANAIRCH